MRIGLVAAAHSSLVRQTTAQLPFTTGC